MVGRQEVVGLSQGLENSERPFLVPGQRGRLRQLVLHEARLHAQLLSLLQWRYGLRRFSELDERNAEPEPRHPVLG
jgi:hypothetical protein